MDFFKSIFDSVSDFFSAKSRYDLSDFQKKKLLHEYHMFYDLNKDGLLEWSDMEMARKNICRVSGWKEGSDQYKQTQELFINIWRSLQDSGDKDFDGKISEAEWVKMWQDIRRDVLEVIRLEKEPPTIDALIDDHMPKWFGSYVLYKFNLYDRAGDGMIDTDEFEYVLSEFNIPAKQCRSAYTMFSESGQHKVDLEYFRRMVYEYYISDDPSALGNFINGKLSYD